MAPQHEEDAGAFDSAVDGATGGSGGTGGAGGIGDDAG